MFVRDCWFTWSELWREHTVLFKAAAAAGLACDTTSSQECRFLATEDMELWEVIVLMGEEGEGTLGTGDEYGGGKVPWKMTEHK